jgi:hypothetical protein
MKVLLKALDAVATVLALLGFTFLIFTSVAWGVSGVFQYLRSMWGSEDRILLIIVGAAVAWCAFRWKELNERPHNAIVSNWKIRSQLKRKRHSSDSNA